MEITKVVKPFIRRGRPNTFGNIVYMYSTFSKIYYFKADLLLFFSFTIKKFPTLIISNYTNYLEICH